MTELRRGVLAVRFCTTSTSSRRLSGSPFRALRRSGSRGRSAAGPWPATTPRRPAGAGSPTGCRPVDGPRPLPRAPRAAAAPGRAAGRHVLHPGLDWVRERVLGDALDLGLGASTSTRPTRTASWCCRRRPSTRPGSTSDDGGCCAGEPRRAGTIAAERLRRDTRAVLRPLGDCDVVTLLGSRVLRTALRRTPGHGAAAVPMRRRGWTRPCPDRPGVRPRRRARDRPGGARLRAAAAGHRRRARPWSPRRPRAR